MADVLLQEHYEEIVPHIKTKVETKYQGRRNLVWDKQTPRLELKVSVKRPDTIICEGIKGSF